MGDLNREQIRIGTLLWWETAASYIRQIRSYGFESYAIHLGGEFEGERLPSLAEQLHHALADSGAVISALGVYGNALLPGPEGEAVIRTWEDVIDQVHLFGTHVVSGFTGRLPGCSVPDSIPRFKEVFIPLAERAACKGVRLAFENCAMGGNWQTGDWNIAFNPTAWDLMFTAVPAANIGLEWEPCHQMVQLIDPLPQIQTWKDRIFHVHGKCASIRHDIIHQQGILGPEPFVFHRTPGFGDCDWSKIISELRRVGFRGSIDIEGGHDPVYVGDLEMTGQTYALRYLIQCRGGYYTPNPT